MPPLSLLTIALLIICACQIGTLILFKQMRRDKQMIVNNIQYSIDMTQIVEWLNEYVRPLDLTERLDRIEQAIDTDGDLTRQRIAQTKTRLADEEKADQKAKAAARRKKAKA